MPDTTTIDRVRQKYVALSPVMDERMRRQWAAAEASALGWGGVTAVAAATGLARNTIAVGLCELGHRQAHPDEPVCLRIRAPGGGRKPLTETDPGLTRALDALVDPATRGHPESPLCWTCKSTSNLAEELQRQGHPVTDRTVATLLKRAGYSLQSNRKTKEGSSHPDRNAQFEYINKRAIAFQRRHQPVVSVDTKKKELVGEFKNAGEEWQPKGKPEEVKVHDFPDKKLGKAVPYGIFDVGRNEGWVSVGISFDTAQFAVAAIKGWWQHLGQALYPGATTLTITADCGGSNSYRTRLWKTELQALADQIGIAIRVLHYPPGTSKWNKIEHRLFSQITMNWRGRPLTSHETILKLIGATTTDTGLTVTATLDTGTYPTGIKISNSEMAALPITRNAFHGDWNYTLHPTRDTPEPN